MIVPVTSSTAFTLIDAGMSRTDLSRRREIKYAFPHMDVGKLRRLLESNCRRQIHNHPISTVRSIYFDDARLSACHANLDGLGSRRKLRLRWYDSIQPTTDFFVEVKWRENRVTGKHRLHFQTNRPLAELSYASIHRNLESVIPNHVVRDVLRYREPIVIVQYNREHFTSDDGLRITLDYDLAFYDQTGRQTISTSFPKRLTGLVVLEGKIPLGRESELRHWLHPLSPRVGRCSKYVHGCCQIGLIHESAL